MRLILVSESLRDVADWLEDKRTTRDRAPVPPGMSNRSRDRGGLGDDR